MSQEDLRKVLRWIAALITAVGAACQIAGVTTVLLANIVLTVGVLLFTLEEVWYSDWIKKVGRYRNAIISVVGCLCGVAVMVLSLWISTLRDSGISYLELDRIAFVEQFSLIKPAAKISFDTFFVQHGPHILHNVMVDSRGIYINDPGSFADPDAAAIQFYKKDLDELRKAALLGEVKGSDLDIGKVIWKTTDNGIDDAQSATSILSGRKRLYALAWGRWTDDEGRTTEHIYCRWLQHPNSPKLRSEELIWHPCKGALQ